MSLQLTRSASQLTGELCSSTRNCFAVKDVKLAADKLTASLYAAGDDKATAGSLDLAFSEDGAALTGKMVDFKRKAACEANPSPGCRFEEETSFAREKCPVISPASGTPSASAGSSAGRDVTGRWALQVPKIDFSLQLSQNGSNVTGTMCTENGKDCMPLLEGSISGGRLTTCVTYWDPGRRQVWAFDVNLSDDGKKLDGTLTSTELGPERHPASFEKQ